VFKVSSLEDLEMSRKVKWNNWPDCCGSSLYIFEHHAVFVS